MPLALPAWPRGAGCLRPGAPGPPRARPVGWCSPTRGRGRDADPLPPGSSRRAGPRAGAVRPWPPSARRGRDPCARERVRAGVVVPPQRDPEVAADVRQPGRAHAPRRPGEPDRAHERRRARLVPRRRAARLQHAAVEGRVVGDQIVRPRDNRREIGPDRAEAGLGGDVLPGDAVQVREPEPAPRRPDQAVVDRADPAVLDRGQAERAGAVRPGSAVSKSIATSRIVRRRSLRRVRPLAVQQLVRER